MKRRSSAMIRNPWLTGVTCDCAWTVGVNTLPLKVDASMPRSAAIADRFLARTPRHVNGVKAFMTCPQFRFDYRLTTPPHTQGPRPRPAASRHTSKSAIRRHVIRTHLDWRGSRWSTEGVSVQIKTDREATYA